jgi:hypothetical protein
LQWQDLVAKYLADEPKDVKKIEMAICRDQSEIYQNKRSQKMNEDE